MVKPFDYCRVSQWCNDKHFTNFSSYSKSRSSCHTTMKYFSISPTVSGIQCALSRSFNQEFISEISGIASGEFALEQQLQKAAIGNPDWWHLFLNRSWQFCINGFRYTFRLDSTTCATNKHRDAEQNIKCFAKIVADFRFGFSIQRVYNQNFSWKNSSIHGWYAQVVDAWADLILPIQQHRRDNWGMLPPWVD